MKKIRVHLLITGKVQGVYYRQTAFNKAVELGLTGWVRNLTGGQVEAVFEGEENMVDKMIEWSKEGPTLARVTHVEVDKQPCLDSFEGVTIKSTFGW